MIDAFNWGVENSAKMLGGSEPLAKGLVIAVIVIPVALIAEYSRRIWIPRFVRWYYDKTITEKAMDWWERNGLAFIGFRQSTAIISITTGAVFYFMIRVAAAAPDYWYLTVPALAGVFIGVAFLGYFVSGNVPPNDTSRNKYFKRFHSPTVTGLGLGVATIIMDLVINIGSLVIAALQST